MGGTVDLILREAGSGCRISTEEALLIHRDADLLDLGRAARSRARQLHGDSPVTFLIDRNINYTNVCTNRCRFCAFFKEPDSPDAYLLSHDEIDRRVGEAVAGGATQIMLQGGLHPDLDLDWFINLFSLIKSRHSIHLHSLSPPEILYLAGKEGTDPSTILQLLVEGGLDSLPGGGAEILSDRVRARVSPRKITSDEWLSVMEAAHGMSLPTTATMMFSLGEELEDRLRHLRLLRELQDRSSGFISFIPWTFQPSNTELGGGESSTFDYLRTLAVSRLFLDNIKNVQGSWITQGPAIGQLSLEFGANDLGSIMLEENVVKAAGTSHRLTRDGMVNLIEGAGRQCAQRNTLFQIIKPCGNS